MAQIGSSLIAPPKNLLEKEEQPTRREIELTIGVEIKLETPTNRVTELEKLLIPNKPPCAARIGIDWQAVLQESERDIAMLAPDRVVKSVIGVDDARESMDRLAKYFVPLPLIGLGIDDVRAKL